MSNPKTDLHRYLRVGREAVMWKLEGLSEFDARRPLVPTGTNLLGLAKHLASVEFGYFGDCFGRPTVRLWRCIGEITIPMPTCGRRPKSPETGSSTSTTVRGGTPTQRSSGPRRRGTRPLVATAACRGQPPSDPRSRGYRDAPPCGPRRHRVRELIDGTVGLRPENTNLPDRDERWWTAYRDRLQRTAEAFRGDAQ